MPRLGHKKSRLGCRQCKARHVKCDELKPCSNCARHGVSCSLTWDSNATTSPRPVSAANSSSTPEISRDTSFDQAVTDPASVPSSSLPIDYVLNPPTTSPGGEGTTPSVLSGSGLAGSQQDRFPFLTSFIKRSQESHSDLWVRDLELMHHWTVEAFDGLSQRSDMRHVWRVDAPKHAVTHPVLMHEILAFAAFHKAYKHVDQRAEYYAFGIHHQDLAIRGIRERLHNVTPQEAIGLVATSTLLTLSVFASTGFEANCPSLPTYLCPISGILNIFSLMQGMVNVLSLAYVQVTGSFLAPMFRDAAEPCPPQPMLQELALHIPTLITFIEGKRDLSETERKVYLDAIAQFEPVLQVAMTSHVDNRELRFLFYWPLHIDTNILEYMRQKRQGALVVLMYYATILAASEPRYWFMERWGDRLIRACYESVDQSWMPAIQWPISFLNQPTMLESFENLLRQRQAPGVQLQVPYTPRPPVILPQRQPGPTPLLSHERRASARTAPYPQHVSTASTLPEQKLFIKTLTGYNDLPSEDVD